nr:hypothetical protein GCM10020092_007780 [Actinoplanes digitatis]
MSRLQRVQENLRRAYESGRESVRTARAEDDGAPDDQDIEFQAPPPEARDEHQSTASRDDSEVPHSLRIAAAWSWRLIVVGVVGWVLLRFIGIISIVVIPLAIALLLSALLAPAVGWLRRFRLPPSFATFLVLICGIGAVVGTLTLVVNQFAAGASEMADKAVAGVRQIRDWARTGPLHLSTDQVEQAIASAQKWLNENTSSLTATGVATATTLFEVMTGALLVLFATFFFLRDGRKIWRFLVRLLPVNVRWNVADAAATRRGPRSGPMCGRPCWWRSSTRPASDWRW